MPDRDQCMLKGRDGLAEGRACKRFGPGLPEVCEGLVPHLTLESMVCQLFYVLGQPVSIEPFDGLDNARMQDSPPLLQETSVGHLVRQGVLEGVCQLGEEARL